MEISDPGKQALKLLLAVLAINDLPETRWKPKHLRVGNRAQIGVRYPRNISSAAMQDATPVRAA
jgi:hypothetical protein